MGHGKKAEEGRGYAYTSSMKGRGRRRGRGWAGNYFWSLPAQIAPIWPKLLCVCSRWRSCSSCPHCHPLSSLPPTVSMQVPESSERASLVSWRAHPAPFLAGLCRVQSPALDFSTLRAVHSDADGPPAVPKKRDTSARDAGGIAPSCRDGCAIKLHIGISWDAGIIHNPELSLIPPTLAGTFKIGQDKGQATKWARGSNSDLAQVLHFHTRREELRPRCLACLHRQCQSG